MSRKTRSTLVLFGMISVLLVLIGCPTKKEIDLRSDNAKITEIRLDNVKVDIAEALKSDGWKTSVQMTTDNVTLNVKPEDDKAIIAVTCNGATVDAKDRTKFVCSALKQGANTIKVVVTAEKGNKSTTATLIVYRKTDSEDTSLKTLKVNDKEILVYGNFITVSVPNATTGIVIIAAPKNEKATLTLKYNDAEIPADASDKTKFACSLKEGDNKIVLQVTAADGKTTEAISVNVHRYTLFEQDPSLKVLKNGNDDILSLIAAPINLTVGSRINTITVTAEPKHYNATVELKCNGKLIKAPENNKTQFICPVNVGDNVITLQVTAADGTTKGSLVTINVHRNSAGDENSSLKSLKITEAPGFAFDGSKTEYNDIPVPYGNVHITAEAYTGAEVKIDGKVSTDPDYGTVAISAAKLQVLVEVTNGGNTKSYTLNFVEAGAMVDIEVLVVDSIGGTKVTGTTLKVFEAGTDTHVETVSVNNGIATVPNLQPNQRYDFKLEGILRQWAGSSIENYYVSALKNQKLTMIQFPHGDHTRGVAPPKVASIMKVSAAGGAETPIAEGDSIDNTLKSIKVNFTSDVGAVEEKAWNGFGAKVGMGLIPNTITGITGNYLGTEYSAPTFTSKYEFELKPGNKNFVFPNGSFDLIIVGYDIANNRVEKHISIKSDSSASGDILDNATFAGMLMISRRSPYSDNIYSNDGGDITHVDLMGKTINGNPLALDPIGDRRSSYRSIMVFNLVDKQTKQPVPIIGFDLYRRIKTAPPGGKFERVSRTIYGSLTTRSHQGLDTDSRLEENNEYEYKVIAYNASHTVESPVLTMKVMESFTYELTAPDNRALLKKADAENINYVCRVSNPNLLKKENADRFNSGLLVLNGQGEALFGSKFRYYYNITYKDGNSGPDLLIDIVNNGQVVPRISYQDSLKTYLVRFGINGLEDLIRVDPATGEITLTSKFTKIGIFNVENYKKGKPLAYTAGTTYQWDMQDWGNNAYDLNDDTPILIIKDYKYTNPDGSQGTVQTQTWGNTDPNGANAINGRFTFTVKE